MPGPHDDLPAQSGIDDGAQAFCGPDLSLQRAHVVFALSGAALTVGYDAAQCSLDVV